MAARFRTINNYIGSLPRRWEISGLRHRCGHARHPVRADLFAVFVCRGHGARVLLLPALCDSVISSCTIPNMGEGLLGET